MDQNSLKHTDSGNPELLSIRWLREWLSCYGENNHSVQVLLHLAEQTERCLDRGDAPPVYEMEGLRALVLSREGGRASDQQPVSKWLPRSHLEKWWHMREDVRTNQLLQKRLTHRPNLVCQVGGGRGNVNRFSFRFEEIEDPATSFESEIDTVETTSGILRYAEEQIKAALWLSWLLPGRPIHLRSARGWILMCGLVACFFTLIMWPLMTLWVVNHPGPLTGTDACLILLACLVAMMIYINMGPWLQLPERRVSIAPDYLMRTDQLYGQLRMIRNKDSKSAGWLSLVRYSSTCTICAGSVELSDGHGDFPGRIIGRCRDSPMEHVFSFDPVSLSGKSLR